MPAERKLKLFKLKSGVVVFAAIAAVFFITKDMETQKNPAAVKNTAAVSYHYKLTTIYDKCGHSIATDGVKGENTGDETVHVNNYCPYHFRFFEKDGLIAVCRMDDPTGTPIQILDVQVSTLPYNDRKALKSGIEVYGEDKMQMLIEDYES